MKNLWNDTEAASCKDDLALRVYSSRLLGREPALVLHGGGNTSVKIPATDRFGKQRTLLYVKGSGWDLATIEAAGFAPVHLDHLVALAGLPVLSDPDMVNELRTHMTDATAPTPSVEAILHAVLPFRFVDHTHADAVVTLTNTPGGESAIREVYGDRVVLIPYVMPGFDLARECARRFKAEAGAQTLGMVLMNHGVFSFADTARESYERMIELVTQAEDYLKAKQAWNVGRSAALPAPAGARTTLAQLRDELSQAAGGPMVLVRDTTPRTRAFIARADLETISQRGPATPDHIIRTKRVPMLGRDVEEYAHAYQRYFERRAPQGGDGLTMLDPAPRVVLDRRLGMVCAGRSVDQAHIVRDLYQHTMDVIERATALDQFQALDEASLFQVEYWDLEQAKLRCAGGAPEFAGEVMLVSGAASGIGRACVEVFLERGAAVAAVDKNPQVAEMFARPACLGMVCDVTDAGQVEQALDAAVDGFGGLDMLILNAGIFPASAGIRELDDAAWRQAMSVNLDANLRLLRECYPLLKRAPAGGRVVVIGSKNVPAPGPGAAAYSASKAALTQLARVAALEWAGDGIRVNTLHPNAVFDTAIWTDEVLASRADGYGLSVEQYTTNNLLGVEVRSRDVARLAARLCGREFSRTTGAQIPVDGGNPRVL